MRHGIGPFSSGRLRANLAPRRPELGLFTLILVPVAVAVSLAVLLTMGATGSGSSLVQVMGHMALPFTTATVGLVFAWVLTRLTPDYLCRSRSLLVALAASYGPYIGGVLLGDGLVLFPGRLLTNGIHTVPTGTALAMLAWTTAVWGLVAVLAHRLADLRDRDRLYGAELALRMRELGESRQRIVKVQEALRKEASDALHGPVQSRLLLASLRLKQALRLPHAEALATIEETTSLIDSVMEKELRDVMRSLHPSVILLGLPAALQSLAEGLRGNLDVRIEVDEAVAVVEVPGLPGIPEGVRLAVYRIAQEALNNVIKHAGATRATVRVGATEAGGLSLAVSDDGRGFDVEHTPQGLGLQSLGDYCGSQGGAVRVESTPGYGTTVRACLPLDQPLLDGESSVRPAPRDPALQQAALR